jgi:C-terminal processing protease CtpA/Prc
MKNQTLPLMLLFLLGFAFPGKTTPPTASIVNEEGGVRRLEGKGHWTNFEIPFQYDSPVVVLLDRGRLLTKRESSYSAPASGQIFGEILAGIEKSPFSFSLDLPAVPQGEFHDVDNDENRDAGVQIWTVMLANNPVLTENEPNLTAIEQLTQLSIVISSLVTKPPTDLTAIAEPISGTLVVYAAAAGQGFPSGFGADRLLFTADDPIVTLPAGYTVVRLAEDGFVFERSPTVGIELNERPEDAEVDLSALSYPEAFNRLIDLLKRRYAYTQLREIDWEVWRKDFLPPIEAAARDRDAKAYFATLEALRRRMQDAHVQLYASSEVMSGEIIAETASLGIDPVELADNRIVARQVLPNSPAAQAGIVPLAEILAVNEVAIGDRVAELAVQSDRATPVTRRLDAVTRSLHFAPQTAVTLRYRNPNSEVQTATLSSQFLAYPSPYTFLGLPYQTLTSRDNKDGEIPPVYGYARWTSFSGDRASITELTDFIHTLNQRRIRGLVIDLRYNGGGSVAALALLISYFWNAENPLYLDRTLSQRLDLETQEPLTFSTFEIPPQLPLNAPHPHAYYGGKIVILVSDRCASACEFFSDWMQRYQRATIIGTHSTIGAGGAVTVVPLPENIEFTYTYTRELDLNHQPYIEAKGVQPDIVVPITEAFIQSQWAEQDPLLDAALQYLNETFLKGED